MTGDAPQPGETPRDDGTPWSPADPASPWWRADEQDPATDRPRNPRRRAAPASPAASAPASASASPALDPPRPARHTGEAGQAHQAGAQDVLAALTGEPPQAATSGFTVPDHLPAAVDRKPAPQQPVAQTLTDRKHADHQAAEPKAAELKAAEPKAAEPKAEEAGAGAPNAMTPKTAEPKIAEAEAGAPNAGMPNAAEPKIAEREPRKRATADLDVPVADVRAGSAAAPRHAQQSPAEPKAAEHDHDRVDAERFNTEGEGTVYAARNRRRPAAPADREPEREPDRDRESDRDREQDRDRDRTIIDLLKTVPADPGAADVMVLPEPDRNRPTVALDRTTMPGQPPSGLPRLNPAHRDPARADRALQDRVRQERTAALLETSPFWKAEEERRTPSWPPPETRERHTTAGHPPRRRAPEPRRPATGLLGLLALGLIAAFFAWVSAEPFWLAVGHGDQGVATVTRCTGSGVTQRCIGQFTAADGAYRVDKLAVFGVEPAQRTPGAESPARMVSSQSRQAYVGSTGVLMHLRWALSFVLVLLCGLGIAGLTGARRLDTVRARRGALLLSVAGPLVLLAGFLSVAY